MAAVACIWPLAKELPNAVGAAKKKKEEKKKKEKEKEKRCYQKNYQSLSMNSVKLQVTKLTHRNSLHFYILTRNFQKEKLRKQSDLQSNQKEQSIQE